MTEIMEGNLLSDTVLDGSNASSGDGKFFNGSCNPNCITEPYIFFFPRDKEYAKLHPTGSAPDWNVAIRITAKQYAYTHCINYSCSNTEIFPGEELVLDYDERTSIVPVEGNIGGAYSTQDCRCLSPFCMGDIARHYLHHRPTDTDCVFLTHTRPSSILTANKDLMAKSTHLKKINIPDKRRLSTGSSSNDENSPHSTLVEEQHHDDVKLAILRGLVLKANVLYRNSLSYYCEKYRKCRSIYGNLLHPNKTKLTAKIGINSPLCFTM